MDDTAIGPLTDCALVKIKNRVFLIYKEIQNGAVAKP
jgi:hypothetical protein